MLSSVQVTPSLAMRAGDLGTQVRRPVRHRVLQRVVAVLEDRSAEHRVELFEREERRVGIAAAEGDDRRIGAELQQLANRRRLDVFHPRGKSSGHHISPRGTHRN